MIFVAPQILLFSFNFQYRWYVKRHEYSTYIISVLHLIFKANSIQYNQHGHHIDCLIFIPLSSGKRNRSGSNGDDPASCTL